MIRTAGISFRPLVAGLLVGTMAFGAAACSGGSSQAEQDQDQTQEVVEKSRMEKLSEELDMSQEAIEAYQRAQTELGKKKPDFEAAKADLQKAVDLEPRFAEAHYNLGVVFADSNMYEKAVPHLERAHDLDSGILEYTVALAQAYASTEQYGRARDMFKEVVARQPANLPARNNLAAMAMREGDDEQALEHVRKVLREDNRNVGALNILGLIYRKRDNLSLAKYAFQKGIKVATEDQTGDKSEDGDDESDDDGDGEQKGGDGKSEQKTADSQDKQKQGDDQPAVVKETADLHNNLGLVFLKEDDIPSAVDHFAAAIYANPNYLESRLNLGSILLEYLDYKRAHKHFSEAVRIAPNNCVARLGLGAAAYATQKFEKSADNYKFYVGECDSEHVSSYERLAELYKSKLDKPRKAIEYYDKLIGLVDEKEKVANYKADRNFLQNQLESEEPKDPEKTGESDGESKEGDGAATEEGDSGETEGTGDDGEKSDAQNGDGAGAEPADDQQGSDDSSSQDSQEDDGETTE